MPAVLIDRVREALEESSDIEYQSRVRTGQGGEDEASSSEGCTEHLFDDSGSRGIGPP